MTRALVLAAVATVAVLAGCTSAAPSSQNSNVAATPAKAPTAGRGPAARSHSNPFIAELDWGSATTNADTDAAVDATTQESTTAESEPPVDNNSVSNEPANGSSPVDVGNSTAPYTNEPFPIQ